MKIYTKTGDEGETGLLGGIRVPKSHLAVQVCGTLDETNTLLGLILSEAIPADVERLLNSCQLHLFDLGACVAGSQAKARPVEVFPERRIVELETAIDHFQPQLPPLRAFILPGGSRAGSLLHLARAVCRRAERELVELIAAGIASKGPAEASSELKRGMIYLNRLSDLLFVLARYVNLQLGCPETEWQIDRETTES